MKPSHFIIAFMFFAALIIIGIAVIAYSDQQRFAALTADQKAISVGISEMGKSLLMILVGGSCLFIPFTVGVGGVVAYGLGRGNTITAQVFKGKVGKSSEGEIVDGAPSGWMNTWDTREQRRELPPPQNQYALSAPVFEEAPPARVLGGRS